jgi:lipopolysaccharide transport system ATP-binding protein
LNNVIEVKNISKSFLLSHENKESYTALRDVITNKAKKLFSFPSHLKPSNVNTKEEFWALNDVSFDIQQGDRVGIIGRNGAGKSTLLKILSRITEPTKGEIKIQGRVASLLEVGTGFHPELTGRENIFLNGAILGMSRAEIKRKFDEIVEFAEVEKFLDTPVKRYSSGMYVRLAFAVAANLEPEILVVDEVLAVGDAQFQKKCLGKMKDVSVNGGRTVLFVSHNMTAMNTLCDRGIYLRNGVIAKEGNIDETIRLYLSTDAEVSTKRSWENNPPGDDAVKLLSARLVDQNGNDTEAIDFYKGGGIELIYKTLTTGYQPVPNIHVSNQKGDFVMVIAETDEHVSTEPGLYKSVVKIPPHFLNDGRYIAGIAASTMIPEKVHFYEKEAIVFDIVEDMNFRPTAYRGIIPGVVRPNFNWKTERLNSL